MKNESIYNFNNGKNGDPLEKELVYLRIDSHL